MKADAFFTNLTKRQSMLLLTAVTFGGGEGSAAFEHLPDEERDVLMERAENLMKMPREKRIPFLVQEIKRLVVGRKGGDLRGADPLQVVAALRGERPALAEVILRALPGSLAEQVRNELPPSRVRLAREVRAEILQVIRWHFERRLERLAPRQASFLFADVHSLSAKDLLTLGDHLGADELGPALAGLEPARRDELLKQFSAEQRVLAAKAANASVSRKMPSDQAAAVLKEFTAEDTRHTVRRAGLRRLTRACLGESPEFASKLAERHRDELGRMLIASIRVERAQGKPRNAESLKVAVVQRLEQLAERGLVERPVRLSPPMQALRSRYPTEKPSMPVIPQISRAPMPVPRPPALPAAPPREQPRAVGRQTTGQQPPLTVNQRANPRPKVVRDPEGSAQRRDVRIPGEVRRVTTGGSVSRDPGGSALHRLPVRPAKVVRGDAAALARPARPRQPPPDDD